MSVESELARVEALPPEARVAAYRELHERLAGRLTGDLEGREPDTAGRDQPDAAERDGW